MLLFLLPLTIVSDSIILYASPSSICILLSLLTSASRPHTAHHDVSQRLHKSRGEIDRLESEISQLKGVPKLDQQLISPYGTSGDTEGGAYSTEQQQVETIALQSEEKNL